jgi:hypothetical protein
MCSFNHKLRNFPFLVRRNAPRKISPYDIVLRYLVWFMACRCVTILRARRRRKLYGWSEPYDVLDQSCAGITVVVYGYGYAYDRPVETLVVP